MLVIDSLFSFLVSGLYWYQGVWQRRFGSPNAILIMISLLPKCVTKKKPGEYGDINQNPHFRYYLFGILHTSGSHVEYCIGYCLIQGVMGGKGRDGTLLHLISCHDCYENLMNRDSP